jgi:hypothetical protein
VTVTPQTIGCAFLLDGPPDPLLIKERILATANSFPRLWIHPTPNGWTTVDPHVSIETYQSSQSLPELLGSLSMQRPFESGLQWRILNLRPNCQRWITLVQWHHAWCDGMGMMPLIKAITSSDECSERPETHEEFDPGILHPLNASRLILHQTYDVGTIDSLRKKYKLTPAGMFLVLVAIGLGDTSGRFRNVILPVSLRRRADDYPLHNHFAAVTARLDTRQGSLQATAEYVREVMRKATTARSVGFYHRGATALGRLPISVQRTLWRFALRSHLCICTALGKLGNQVTCGGRVVRSILAMPAPVFRQPYAFSWLKYGNEYTLTAVLDQRHKCEVEDVFQRASNALSTL